MITWWKSVDQACKQANPALFIIAIGLCFLVMIKGLANEFNGFYGKLPLCKIQQQIQTDTIPQGGLY